jgi:hypothetical protein
LIPVANLPPVTAFNVHFRKDLTTGVSNTGGVTLVVNISANFRKKFKWVITKLSGAWGKMIHESKPEAKIPWICPFNTDFKDFKMADLTSGAPGVRTRVV